MFWDFSSLHQHAGNPTTGKRLPSEDVLFKKALSNLGLLYGAAHTTVFMLTALPEDYPEAYELPEGANVNPYLERGWVCRLRLRPATFVYLRVSPCIRRRATSRSTATH